MPRANRRRVADPRPLSRAADVRRESLRGEDYLVRPSSAAAKPYRCPGCHQLIPPGTPHVVAWPDGVRGAEDRRHWHTACWAARERR